MIQGMFPHVRGPRDGDNDRMGMTSVNVEEIMQTTHPQPNRESHRPSSIRKAVATLLVLLASVLTLFTGYGAYDALTGDYVGGETSVVWLFTGIAAFLALLGWMAAVAYLRRVRS